MRSSFTVIIMNNNTTQIQEFLKTRENDALKYALYDHMTEIPNRSFFIQRIEDQLKMSIENSSKFALLCLDIDNFKLVNNHLGHNIGDQLLKNTSKIIQNNLEQMNFFARFGSDEFVILLNEINSIQHVKAVASKIKKIFKKPIYIFNLQIKITFSIGIVLFPDNGTSTKNLIQSLDSALSHAKNLGGARFVYFPPEINHKRRYELELEYDLPYAIEKNELFLVFQPQIHYKEKKIVGVEALLRWNHPTLGLIPPDDFIPIAEKNGLMSSIGFWVFEEACNQLNNWKSNSIQMSINLSLAQISIANLGKQFSVICRKYKIRPNQVVLELTETTLTNIFFDTSTVVKELHQRGFSLALDDFGVGYSSFSRLSKLPISSLKIDKSFVMNLKGHFENRIIIRAILNLASGLGIKVIAEGVSTAEEIQFLINNDCVTLQGFYFYKPMLPKKIMTLLKSDLPDNFFVTQKDQKISGNGLEGSS